MNLFGYSNLTKLLRKTIILLILCISSLISIGSSRILAQNGINSGIGLNKAIYSDAYVLDGDWLYYRSLYDSKLYKMNIEGNEKELILSDSISEYGLVVVDDWIYYINADDDDCLYRINVKGDKKTKISSRGLIEYYGNFFNIEDYIYFFEHGNIVFKYNIISGEIKRLVLNEANIIKRFTPGSKLKEKKLYHQNQNGIFEMNTDTGNIKKISSINVYGEIIVEDNWIYYINNDDLKLYRVDAETRKSERISEGKVITVGADYESGAFCLYNNQVYFTDTSVDESRKLWRFDGEDKSKVVIQDTVDHFVMSGDYLYYIDRLDNGGLYRMKEDGSDIKMITSGEFIPYTDIKSDMIFYMMKSESIEQPVFGRLFKIKIDGENKTEIM